MIPRYIVPVSGRYSKILNFKEVCKIQYRYTCKIQILLEGPSVVTYTIRAGIIVY